MSTRKEQIEFIRDVLCQAHVRECIGKACEECKFYNSPNCFETCYATELVDMGIVQIPAEKQNAPEAKTIDLSKTQEFSPVTPEAFAQISKVVTSSVETYVTHRLETFVNTIKEHAQPFLMRDTSNGQYHDEQCVPVVTIDHIFSLLSSPERE